MEPSKYARVEDEQRFVVAAVPPGASAPREIDDRYLVGTRLRLRRVTDEHGSVRKLGHKVRLDAARPSVVWHTTCYLDDEEYERLAVLEARTLRKRRWTIGPDACADEFLGALQGLVLVEGERPCAPPVGAVEVTDDERFCGGSLAGLDARAAAAVVADATGRLA